MSPQEFVIGFNPTTRTVLAVLLVFFLALLLTRFSRPVTGYFISATRFAPRNRQLPERRLKTLHGLLAGIVSVAAFTAASLFCMAQFVEVSTLIWMIGLFSAAFGLGIRPLISDFMTGAFFVFEDTLDVGEKVEIMGIEGVVEEVNFRVVQLRGISGELYVIPNGEIRVIRNFSRGDFSPATVRVRIASDDLEQALALLDALGQEAMTILPNLISPWKVIMEEGAVGATVDLTITAHARFGKAAEMRPRLLVLLRDRFAEAGLEFASDT